MFHIQMIKDDMYIDMPNDTKLDLFEACHRAEIYKKKNPSAVFRVINSDNLDIEMEI